MPWLSDGPITYSGNVKVDEGPSTGFTVHVRIKPNLRWSDGEPFSLNDMKYTWTAVLDPAQYEASRPSAGTRSTGSTSPPTAWRPTSTSRTAFAGWLGVVAPA